MEIIKNTKWLIVFAVVILVGTFSFFYSFRQHDNKAFADFFTSYEKFDKAILDFSSGETPDLESQVSDAFIELDTTATVFRPSSFVEHDAELMKKALEIADISKKELSSLRAYKNASQSKNVDLDRLAKEHDNLTNERKIAYASFRKLAGLEN